MITTRRSLLCSIAVTLCGAETLFARGLQVDPPPPSTQIPGAGQSGRFPDREPRLKPDPKRLLKENQKKLRSDADNLLQLAQDLKTEADRTEQTDVLSVSLIRKAEKIEKLAKRIKSLARSA